MKVEIPSELVEEVALCYRLLKNETKWDNHEARLHYTEMLEELVAEKVMAIIYKQYLHNWNK